MSPYKLVPTVLLAIATFATACCAAPVTYSYDALDRLTGVYYNCTTATTYVYDLAGNRSSGTTAAITSCPPVANNDGFTTALNTPHTIDPRVNDSDPAGFSITVTSNSTPAHGAVTIATGGVSVSYTPTTGYSGSDSFTYTISNGHGGSATATIVVTVTP